MISRYAVVNNGGVLEKEYYFYCDTCGKEMYEGDPIFNDKPKHFCPECAFLTDKIDAEEYKKFCYFLPSHYRVGKHDGEIYCWDKGKAPWDKKDKDHRNTQQYKDWRQAVFKRDNYTCIMCGDKSGIGNSVIIHADHIKSFAQYPDLRFDINNGRTLCKSCHEKTDTYQKRITEPVLTEDNKRYVLENIHVFSINKLSGILGVSRQTITRFINKNKIIPTFRATESKKVDKSYKVDLSFFGIEN